MAEEKALALYIHWPFCLAKCPYCDFNSHVRGDIDHAAWRRAYLAELNHYASETKGRSITSIFFGGGTPSLMEPGTVAAVLEAIAGHWTVDPGAEITLEANPTSADGKRFSAYCSAGINRISLGVQALDAAALRFLGREHSAGEARKAITVAQRNAGRTSFDLIYGRPDQSPSAWREELGEAIALAGEHLSAYQLTFEPGTPFGARAKRGEITPPDEDVLAELYEDTQAMLADAGLPAYEISNHARPGAESRHNLTYWRYGDYLGIGPGAHGRLTGGAESAESGVTEAIEAIRSPEGWCESVTRQGHGVQKRQVVTITERIDEILMMGLRLTEGIDRGRFQRRAGRALEDALDPTGCARMVAGGFITLDQAGLRATSAGRQRLNAVIAQLAPDSAGGISAGGISAGGISAG